MDQIDVPDGVKKKYSVQDSNQRPSALSFNQLMIGNRCATTAPTERHRKNQIISIINLFLCNRLCSHSCVSSKQDEEGRCSQSNPTGETKAHRRIEQFDEFDGWLGCHVCRRNSLGWVLEPVVILLMLGLNPVECSRR